jgi:hypothetical protein
VNSGNQRIYPWGCPIVQLTIYVTKTRVQNVLWGDLNITLPVGFYHLYYLPQNVPQVLLISLVDLTEPAG